MERYRTENFKGTFSCGHKGSITVGGYSKEYRKDCADDIFSGLCLECEDKKMAGFNRENGFPDLRGSEKQIRWANRIRQNFFNSVPRLDEYVELLEKHAPEYPELQEQLEPLRKEARLTKEIVLACIYSCQSARFYIDKRDDGMIIPSPAGFPHDIDSTIEAMVRVHIYCGKPLIRELKENFYKCPEETNLELEKLEARLQEEEELKASMMIPEEHNGINVTIRWDAEADQVILESPKNSTIIEMAKLMGMSWAYEIRSWSRIVPKYESCLDYQAHLIARFLEKGFGVRCLTREAVKRALDGQYEPYTERWIYAGNDPEAVRIHVNLKSGSFYTEARSLPRAKHDRGYYIVKTEYFREIRDFADAYGFKLTPAADQKLREKEESFSKIQPIEVKVQPESEPEDKIKKILDTPTDVLEDLIDD